MFICHYCGTLCEELSTTQEHRPYMEGGCVEEITNDDCLCGGYFAEAVKCERCGDWVSKDKGLPACENCKEAVVNCDNAIEYIKDEELQLDFFVEYWTYSKVHHATRDLTEICEKSFTARQESIHTKEQDDARLFEFVKDEFDDFWEWVIKKQK